MSLENQVKIFKWISILEGLSFLFLLFIAMPLKYLYEMPQMVQQVGMAHGILFIAYLIGALLLFRPMNWNVKEMGIILGCSVLPFGPFYVEKKYL
jgi:integral membrane protein